MILDDASHMELAVGCSRHRPGAARDRLAILDGLDTIAHEAGHILTGGWHRNPKPPPIPATPGKTPQIVTLRHEDEPPILSRPCPWFGHNVKFIRAYYHCHFRLAKMLGVRSSPGFDLRLVGMGDGWKYASAMGDEPERLADMPLDGIADIAPPKRLMEQWRCDLREWWTGLDAPTREQTVLFFHGLEMI